MHEFFLSHGFLDGKGFLGLSDNFLLNAFTELLGIMLEIVFIVVIIQGLASYRDHRARNRMKKWTASYLRELLFDYLSETKNSKKFDILQHVNVSIGQLSPYLSHGQKSKAMLFLHYILDYQRETERLNFLKMTESFLDLQTALGVSRSENAATLERLHITNV